MKSIEFSLLIIMCLVYCFTDMTNAAIPCSTFGTKAEPCVPFASGKAMRPSPACCSGLQWVARSIKTVEDKRAICRCVKESVNNLPGIQDRFLRRIPAACHIKLGYPFSIKADCEKLR